MKFLVILSSYVSLELSSHVEEGVLLRFSLQVLTKEEVDEDQESDESEQQ